MKPILSYEMHTIYTGAIYLKAVMAFHRELLLYLRDSFLIVKAVSGIFLFFGYLTRETLLTVSMNDYKIKVLYD